MPNVTFEESQLIHTSPKAVYDLLADYEYGHPLILPKPYFSDLKILQGGTGGGTIIEVVMEVFGVKRTLHMEVVEIEAGRVLAEFDHDAGIETHFICDEVDSGCLLTIRTTMQFADGVVGFIEKLTTPRITRNIYRKELQLIAEHCEKDLQPS